MNRQLPKATPALAKAVWMAQRSPSVRSVARALTQRGRPTHFTTVARWRRRGWRAQPAEHPLEHARANLESALPLITDDPTSRIEDLLRAAADDGQLSDAELLRKSAREVARTICVVSHGLMRQPDLVMSHLGELAVLARSLTAGLQAAMAGFAQAEKMQASDNEAANDRGKGA
jgi:hypothetical protein